MHTLKKLQSSAVAMFFFQTRDRSPGICTIISLNLTVNRPYISRWRMALDLLIPYHDFVPSCVNVVLAALDMNVDFLTDQIIWR